MSRATRFLAMLMVLGLVGCGSTIPRAGGLVPEKTVQLSPSFGMPLEKLVFWGAYAATAYLILDPLAPNWVIEEAQLPGNHVHLSMKMKRYYTGGAGEARLVFQRRAKDLAQAGGFDGYEVIEYSEGLESSILGSQRFSEGVIRLTGKGALDQGSAPPARSTVASAPKPLS